MLRGVAKLAVAVSVVAPGFSKGIEQADVARWAKAGGVAYLIPAAWTEGEAAEQGVVVSDANVREAMQSPHDGLGRAELIYESRISLLNSSLRAPIQQAAAESVTQPEIDAYVAANPKLGPEERSVYVMRLRNRATAERALAALNRGLTLRHATKRYANRKTRLRSLSSGELDRRGLDRAIFKAPERAYRRYGIYVFRVKAILPRRPLPVAQQNAQAWELLASRRQEQALGEYKAAIVAKWRPRTTCEAALFTPDFCSNSPMGQ